MQLNARIRRSAQLNESNRFFCRFSAFPMLMKGIFHDWEGWNKSPLPPATTAPRRPSASASPPDAHITSTFCFTPFPFVSVIYILLQPYAHPLSLYTFFIILILPLESGDLFSKCHCSKDKRAVSRNKRSSFPSAFASSARASSVFKRSFFFSFPLFKSCSPSPI